MESEFQMINFGQLVKQKRKEHGLTQSRFADHARIAQGTLSKIESNKIDPSFKIVQKIARALNLKLTLTPVKK